MRILILIAIASVAMSSVAFMQGPCAGWTFTHGWSVLSDASAVHVAANPGASPLTNGPEDLAYNPATGTLFVIQDNPNATPDILLEYDLQGRFLSGSEMLPGNGGLCAHPNGNLLLAFGNSVVEIDTAGNAVAGGVSVAASGFGNIQDLDFDAAGALWIHDGNAGAWSILDTATGAVTLQFVTPFGSQGFCFRGDNGNIMAAGAFFNAGAIGTNTLVEINPAGGALVCQGASPTNGSLTANGDTCPNAAAPQFPILNGMTWIGPLKELAVDSFFQTAQAGVWAPMNVGRFAPAGTAFVGKVGQDGVRTDNGLPLRGFVQGDPVIGSGSIQIRVENADPLNFVVLGASTARDCNNTVVSPATGSSLYIIPFAPTGFFIVLPTDSSGETSIPVSLVTAPPALAGTDLYAQWLTTQLGTGDTVTSAALRIRLDLN